MTEGWTDTGAIGALPVCLRGHVLEEYHAASREQKTQVVNRPTPTLRAPFEHLNQVKEVTRNNRTRRNEFIWFKNTFSYVSVPKRLGAANMR